MARYPLDAPLGPLCSDAERNAIQVRKVVGAHRHLRLLGAEPEALADELARAAEAGREAHTARILAHLAFDKAAEATREAAQAAYDLQQDLRAICAALLALDRPRWAAPVDELRGLLRLKAPRIRSGLDQLRHLRDHLARPDHPLLAHPVGVALRDRIVTMEADHARAVAARADALRERRARVRAAQQAREVVKGALRKVRDLWRTACRLAPTLPSFHLEASARAVAGRGGDEREAAEAGLPEGGTTSLPEAVDPVPDAPPGPEAVDPVAAPPAEAPTSAAGAPVGAAPVVAPGGVAPAGGASGG